MQQELAQHCKAMKSHFLKKMRKNKVPRLQFHPPDLSHSMFLALPSGRGFWEMKFSLTTLPYYKASTAMDPLNHFFFFFGADSLYLLSVFFMLSTSTCGSSFRGTSSSYWNDFLWSCLEVSFPPGSPWPITNKWVRPLCIPVTGI